MLIRLVSTLLFILSFFFPRDCLHFFLPSLRVIVDCLFKSHWERILCLHFLKLTPESCSWVSFLCQGCCTYCLHQSVTGKKTKSHHNALTQSTDCCCCCCWVFFSQWAAFFLSSGTPGEKTVRRREIQGDRALTQSTRGTAPRATCTKHGAKRQNHAEVHWKSFWGNMKCCWLQNSWFFFVNWNVVVVVHIVNNVNVRKTVFSSVWLFSDA